MPERAGPRIVAAIGSEANRASLMQALAETGYDICTASTAEEALLLVQKHPTALLVFESGLPDMNEAEFLRRLRALQNASALAIIQTTPQAAHPQTRIQALQQGADAYLDGMEQDEIVAHIHALMRRSHGMKAALVKSENRFALVEEGTELGVWFCDLPFDHLHWNAYVKKHFFLAAEAEVTIDTFYDYMHADDREPTRRAIQHAIDTGERYDTVFRTCDPHSDRVNSIRALGRTTYDASGQPIHFDGITLDMTEHKKAEEAIRLANRRKDEFLANMSHEIRTPMNAVVGLTHILAMSEPLTSKQRECIRTLQASGQSLLALINDLLDIAKIESDEINFESVPFSLCVATEDVVRVLSVRATEKDIGLRLLYAEDMPEQYVGDSLRVRQIVTNLLSNAVKFTEQGDVVLSVSAMREGVRIAVQDTGIGIAEDKLETIFNKFSQGDGSITRKYGGTGLGLAITRSIVERMHGRIEVQSTPGQGSTFIIELPLSSAQPRPKAAMPAESDAIPVIPDAPLILLVEDYAPNVLVATCLLDSLQLRYDVANNGQEALERTETQDYDLILMDVQMPVMDGYTATQKLREREAKMQTIPTPIIGITAYALSGDREKCLAAGMNDYISKPFNMVELKSKILALLTRSALRRSA